MAATTTVRHSAVERNRADFDGRPICEAITPRGKELSEDDTVATARRLFARRAVQVLPVLRGSAYVGAVDRGSVAGVPGAAAVSSVASVALPTAIASTPAEEALAVLDRAGAKRLVVLDPDGTTYVGLVCMRADRERLCVDASGRSDGLR